MSSYYLIPCQIECGGFPSERAFEIDTNEGKLFGLAYYEHLFDENKKQLQENIPAVGETLKGFVKCLVVKNNSESQVLIEIPGADVLNIQKNELQEMIPA